MKKPLLPQVKPVYRFAEYKFGDEEGNEPSLYGRAYYMEYDEWDDGDIVQANVLCGGIDEKGRLILNAVDKTYDVDAEEYVTGKCKLTPLVKAWEVD